MGAIPARWAFNVDFIDGRYMATVSAVASNRPQTPTVTVPLGELSRQEIRRAAVCIKVHTNRSDSNAEMIAKIVLAVDARSSAVPTPTVDPTPTITVDPEPTPTVYDGKHKDFGKVLARVQAGLTPWLHGEAGTGKTTLAIQIAEHLGLPFYGKSVTAQLTEVSFFGYTDARGEVVRTPFREAWENGGIFLLDEASSATPNLAAGINMALANGKVAFPDAMIDRHDDCIIIAAANDTGQGPTPKYPKGIKQDASFLDRFVMTELVLDERVVLEGVAARLECEFKRSQWLSLWRMARQNAQTYGLNNVVITPRSAFDGATLVAIGESWRSAAIDAILKGDTSDTARKVLEGTGITL